MLINLSNHPTSAWSEEQIQAARSQYGEIVDLAFPQIAPDADIDSVLELAQEYADKCTEMLNFIDVYTFDYKTNAVHVMGEMTFTYNVVRYLSRHAIGCVASTTERFATVDQLGMKTSVFRFVQFRGYSSINEIP